MIDALVAALRSMMVIDAPADFVEADYLEANPDVAAAVQAGHIASGELHFTRYGYNERRSIKPGVRPAPLPLPFPTQYKPSRRDKMLADLDLPKLRGVEIGALSAPVVAPEEGNIFFVDFTDTDTLKKNYAADSNIDVDKIVDVGGIWGEKTLRECVGEDEFFDFVVASHVIEHTPDLITWLAEIRSILKPSGTLRLAIPDRRYTFDYLRFESRIHDVLDSYLKKARVPTPHQIIDFCSLSRSVDCAAAWNGELDLETLKPFSSTKFGLHLAKTSLAEGTYFDTHCWVFTPASFVDLCLEMAELDLLGFICTALIATQRNELEFYAHMSPSDDKAAIVESWTRLKTALPKVAPGELIQTA